MSTETIFFDYLSQAQSDSYEAQHRALRALASLTKVSPPRRDSLAQTQSAIPTLITLSKSSSPTTQALSLSILFNLSLNPNLKQTLANAETIRHLNSIIASPTSPEPANWAAILICSLSMLDKNKARFGVTGTIQVLVKALEDALSPAAPHILSSLAELVQFHGNSTLAVRSGAVPVLIRIAGSANSEDLAGSSLTVLCILVRCQEGMEEMRGRGDGIVRMLVGILKRKCMMSKESAAEILNCLFEESEEYVKEAVKMPEFSSLLADLSVRGSVKAREKTALLMRKMMEANLDCYVEGNPMVLHW